MAQPDYNAQLEQILGGGSDDLSGLFPWLAIASNVVTGTSPPYSATQFFAQMPNFGGTPTVVTGTTTAGSVVISGLTSPAGAAIAVGQYVTAVGVDDGATVAGFVGSQTGAGTLTLSLPALASGTPVNVTVYTAPLVSNVVLNAYIALAAGSIFQARWCEMWPLAMANYIAHYCTLWAMGQSGQATNLAQLAIRGAARGIATSKSADGLSVGITLLGGFEDWGTYGLTLYGEIFATWAGAIGSGPMLLV